MTGSADYFLPGYVQSSDDATLNIRSIRMQGTSEYNSYTFSGLIELNSGEEAWISSLAYDDFLVSSSQFSGYLVTALEQILLSNPSRFIICNHTEIVQTGFMVQDVEKLAKELGYDFSDVD